jgi:hypothetical protein
MCGYVLASDISTEPRSINGSSFSKEKDLEGNKSLLSNLNGSDTESQKNTSQASQSRQALSTNVDSGKPTLERSERIVRNVSDSSEGRIRVRTAKEQDPVLSDTVNRLRSTGVNHTDDANGDRNASEDLAEFGYEKELSNENGIDGNESTKPIYLADESSDSQKNLKANTAMDLDGYDSGANPLGDYLLGDEPSIEDYTSQLQTHKEAGSDYNNDDSINDFEIKKEIDLDSDSSDEPNPGSFRVAPERDRSKAFRLGGNTAFPVQRPETQKINKEATIQTSEDDEVIPKQFPFSEEPLADPFSSSAGRSNQSSVAEDILDNSTEVKSLINDAMFDEEPVTTSIITTTSDGSQLTTNYEPEPEPEPESNGLHAQFEDGLVNYSNEHSQISEIVQQEKEFTDPVIIESELIDDGQNFLDPQHSFEPTNENNSSDFRSDLYDTAADNNNLESQIDSSDIIAESPTRVHQSLKEEEDTDKHLIGWLVSYDRRQGHSIEIREGKFFISSRIIKEGDLVIEDESISAPHAMMNASLEGVKVQDLMSNNGLFILRGNASHDWKREEDVIRLNHGDWVRFGKISYLVCLIPYDIISVTDPLRAE